ncbi:MAG: LysM peptidoglycan-binding domain-containing protein [Bacteroidota bacterium]
MTRYICLSLLLLTWGSLLMAQSGYQDTPTHRGNDTDPVYEKLDSLQANYRFSFPKTSLYDSLILNTYRFAPDEVPVYSEAILQQRLAEIPAVIPMDFNHHVSRFISLYTLERRDQVSRMLGLSRVYFPIFEEALDREGMPVELKYLPVVESALNPHARSRVGATGLWQFMLSTGRLYGLKVNSYVDERKNPFKATEAALRYLKNAHREFGDWLLAIASYNCGVGNVRKAIIRSGGKRNFWQIMPYLPRETRGYVPAFIAATYTFNYAAEHNLYPIYVNFDFNEDTVHIKRMDISLDEIGRLTGIPSEVLKNMNPELKLNRVPYSSKTYVLRVPFSVAEYFQRNHYYLADKYAKKVPVHTATASYKPAPKSSKRPSGSKLVYHTVRSGEVVGTIAERYHVSPRSIARWNNLRNYRIRAGQKLKIYTYKKVSNLSTKPSGTSSSLVASAGSSKKLYHTVQKGDTIWTIAKQYHGTSMKSILALNNGLNTRNMKVGQTIRVK